MKSKDIKRMNETEEIFEEAPVENFGEDSYQSPFSVFIDKASDKYNNFKKKKMFFPIIIAVSILAFTLIIYLTFLIGNMTVETSGLTSIEGNFPETVYINEEVKFSVKAYGKGDLSNTKFSISIPDLSNGVVKDEVITGTQITGIIKGIKIGTFSVNVVATNANKKEQLNIAKIAVCKRLTKERLEDTIIKIEPEQKKSLYINLGDSNKCSKNLKYEVADSSIIAISANNQITGLKRGTTTVTIREKLDEVTITVIVI